MDERGAVMADERTRMALRTHYETLQVTRERNDPLNTSRLGRATGQRVLLALALGATVAAYGQTGNRLAQPSIDRDVLALLGPLPTPGSIQDVLLCAGANEVVWTELVRANPYDRSGLEAKRKAGWYAGVALRVFAVQSSAVVDAVNAARQQDRGQVAALAKSCRGAPDNWRE